MSKIRQRFERLYQELSTEAFVERFGYKNTRTVRATAARYGIKKWKRKFWTPEEIKILEANMWRKYYVKHLKLDRPRNSIYIKVAELRRKANATEKRIEQEHNQLQHQDREGRG